MKMEYIHNQNTHKKNTLGSALILLSLIDLLFLPRLTYPFSIPISIIPVLYICIAHHTSKTDAIKLIALTFILFASVLNSAFNLESSIILDNAKRALQLITVLFYGVLALNNKASHKSILLIFRIFFIWILFLTLWFWSSPFEQVYFQSNLYPESVGIHEINLEGLRFSYAFQDPNSAGYLITMCLAVYLYLDRSTTIKSLISMAALISVFSTQSRGALISIIILILIYFLSTTEAKKASKLYFLILLSIVLILFINLNDKAHEVLDIFLARGDIEDSIGGGRIQKYEFFLSNLNLMPFGAGYYLEKDGLLFRPHSDLIRIVLSYGLIALALILSHTIPKTKNQILLLIPFLVGFLVNSIIDDYRLFGVFLIGMGVLLNTQNNHFSENQVLQNE